MQETSSTSDLIQLLKGEVSLLHQLHILSQTESLILEKDDLTGLEEVVARKKSIVETLWSHVERLGSCLCSKDEALSGYSFAQKQELELLRFEANHLIQRIANVDRENMERLECFRSKAVEDSHLVHQHLAIHKAYTLSQQTLSSQFSHLSD
jgi:hypothetical protein